MRGEDLQQHDLFSYGSLEDRVPANHPLRPMRLMVDEALKGMDKRFSEIYGEDGRKSIPPERLLRALLVQMLYSVRSERMLIEQLEYNLLFRWFVGLSADEPVWHPTVFTKNRDRLLEGAVAEEFFSIVVEQARRKKLLSDEHFTVDGTLIEAWAGQKSFRAKDKQDDDVLKPPPSDPGSNPTLNYRKEKRSNCNPRIANGSVGAIVQEEQRIGSKVELFGACGYGQPPRVGDGCMRNARNGNGRARRGGCHAAAETRQQASDARSRSGLRYPGLHRADAQLTSNTTRSAE